MVKLGLAIHFQLVVQQILDSLDRMSVFAECPIMNRIPVAIIQLAKRGHEFVDEYLQMP